MRGFSAKILLNIRRLTDRQIQVPLNTANNSQRYFDKKVEPCPKL